MCCQRGACKPVGSPVAVAARLIRHNMCVASRVQTSDVLHATVITVSEACTACTICFERRPTTPPRRGCDSMQPASNCIDPSLFEPLHGATALGFGNSAHPSLAYSPYIDRLTCMCDSASARAFAFKPNFCHLLLQTHLCFCAGALLASRLRLGQGQWVTKPPRRQLRARKIWRCSQHCTDAAPRRSVSP